MKRSHPSGKMSVHKTDMEVTKEGHGGNGGVVNFCRRNRERLTPMYRGEWGV